MRDECSFIIIIFMFIYFFVKHGHFCLQLYIYIYIYIYIYTRLTVSVVSLHLEWMFSVDSVLHHSSQELVYSRAVTPLVSQTFDGYGGCVMAYGQVGSGEIPHVALKDTYLSRKRTVDIVCLVMIYWWIILKHGALTVQFTNF